MTGLSAGWPLGKDKVGRDLAIFGYSCQLSDKAGADLHTDSPHPSSFSGNYP
jgi:hypothetical protein